METSDNETYLCYNASCGQTFKMSENREDSCVYHPGVPVFHDAYKSWSCCNKKTTDFTEFLSIKGCKVGLHSNVKPVPKPVVQEDKTKESLKQMLENISRPIENEPEEKPSSDLPTIQLSSKVTPSLKAKLEQYKKEFTLNKSNLGELRLCFSLL